MDESDKSSHFTEVIQPNRLHADRVVQELRKQAGQVVINPAAMSSVPGWTQQDWRSFWSQVIERYVTAVVFVNDWQYSNGCVYEFWVAQKKGIPTMDEQGCSLEIEQGTSMILEARDEMRQYGAYTGFLEQVLSELEKMSTLGESSTK